MWQPLSRILDALGRFRLPIGPSAVRVLVGNPNGADALGGFEWQRYTTAEALYEVWGPIPESPWEPYHCVPLFAALGALKPDVSGFGSPFAAGPTTPELAANVELPPHLDGAARGEALGQSWAGAGVWVILDLPGVQSVTLATRLIRAGYQPVCTFDHWPHPAGLLHPEWILGHLLRFASTVAGARQSLTPASPPLWICDRERLGTRPGNPHEFDNRYFLDDSLLPGPDTLRRAGIQHIVCVVPDATCNPLEDLHAYFDALRKEGFADIHGAALNDPELHPFDFVPRATPSRFSGEGYQRSASGGFGRLIPEVSSSSG
jgi:hypothetical protein